MKATLIEHGVPHRLLIDNGAAYRDTQLKTICAHLRIHLCFARPYEACQKGKIERLHRTIREQFLAECTMDSITSLNELNARLWAWVRCHYHLQHHSGLAEEMSPMACFLQGPSVWTPLGEKAASIDDYFYHRFIRRVRKDGTISLAGTRYEVPHYWAGQRITAIVDPQLNTVIRAQSPNGEVCHTLVPLDKRANFTRTRQRPTAQATPSSGNGESLVDACCQQARDLYTVGRRQEATDKGAHQEQTGGESDDHLSTF